MMKTKYQKFLTAYLSLLILGGTGVVYAKYVLEPFERCRVAATHIVDATVVEVTKENHVKLTIHEQWKGAGASTILKRIQLTCTGEAPGVYLKANSRYVLMLLDTNAEEGSALYEGTLCYPITKKADGTEGCQLTQWQKQFLGVDSEWIPLGDMKKLMTTKDEKKP